MPSKRTGWLVLGALAVVTIVLVLQGTKQAMLARTQTNVLWGAEVASLVSVLLLRSGWMRDNRWREEQRRLGTLANNFYEPRREHLISGFAIGFGVLGGLWWGLATWAAVLGGVRRGVVGRGLADFEVAALCGAITGALVGAVIGLAVGHLWENAHRRSRQARSSAHA
jgi:hypothetical protein